MKRILMLWAIATIFFFPVTILIAQEGNDQSPIVSVSQDAKLLLNKTRSIAIFLNGNDPFLLRILEDALCIKLTNEGFTIINREILEKTIGEEVVKKKKENEKSAINSIEIGSAVGADAILIGTVFITPDEQQSMQVKMASFQLLDVESQRATVELMFEFQGGTTFLELASTIVNTLKKSMG